MKKKGSKNETTRSITKTGDYTYYVTIPKAYLDELGWKERGRVSVKKVGRKLIMEKWKK